MDNQDKKASANLAPLTSGWLMLVALTLASLYLGQWFHGSSWLPPLVAALIWLKGMLVARRFIEIGEAHAFIRRVVYGFIAFTPLALVVVSYFGRQVARWTSL